MTTGYQGFAETTTFKVSREILLENDKNALTDNAGTAFPTVGVADGMSCYRTDEKKLYKRINGTWVCIFDNSDQPLKKTDVMQGATESTAGIAGAVPPPQAGKQGMFLRGDGTWAQVAGTDNKTAQTVASDDAEHPILFKKSASETDETSNVGYSVNGVTINPSNGVISAPMFVGVLSGNASSATRANQDGEGNDIASTYLPRTEVEALRGPKGDPGEPGLSANEILMTPDPEKYFLEIYGQSSGGTLGDIVVNPAPLAPDPNQTFDETLNKGTK